MQKMSIDRLVEMNDVDLRTNNLLGVIDRIAGKKFGDDKEAGDEWRIATLRNTVSVIVRHNAMQEGTDVGRLVKALADYYTQMELGPGPDNPPIG